MSNLIKISALGVALSLGSCMSPIDIPYEDAKQVVTILFDGTANDADSVQTMRITQTHIGNFDPVKRAQIELQADGAPVVVDEMPVVNDPAASGYRSRKPGGLYTLRHRFLPGQSVRIAVRHAGKLATAECVVPQLPEILGCKVEDVEWYDGDGYKRSRMRWSVRLKDKAGERNYYRLAGFYQPVYENVQTKELITMKEDYRKIELDGKSDPIISDGNPRPERESTDIQDVLGTAYANRYNVFSDRLFDGQEVSLSLTSARIYLYDFYGRLDGNPFTAEIEEGGRLVTKELRFLHFGLTVVAYGITEDMYKYYLSLGKFDASDEESPFSTPVQLYSNVAGGAGIFGISTPARHRIAYKPTAQ